MAVACQSFNVIDVPARPAGGSHQKLLGTSLPDFWIPLDLLPAFLIRLISQPWLWHHILNPAPWGGLGIPQGKGIEYPLALPEFRPSSNLAWIIANILWFLSASDFRPHSPAWYTRRYWWWRSQTEGDHQILSIGHNQNERKIMKPGVWQWRGEIKESKDYCSLAL